MFDLRSWLRRAPKPKKLRIKTGDGEERVIELGKGRYLWNEVEQTVRTAEAISVECLDGEGTILRATKLSEEDGEDGPEVSKEDKSLSKAIRDQAAMLDRYGARLNEAFAMGSKAASQSSDKLVELVEVLTNHLAIAITNVNNLSVNLSNALQAANPESPEQNPAMAMVTAMLQAKMMGPANATTPATPTNGKGKKP
jgi:hypothetical protein